MVGERINPTGKARIAQALRQDNMDDLMEEAVAQAEEGAAVKTAAGGTVQSVTDDELMGTTVVIDHEGGYSTRYSSLQKDVPVTAGQQVVAGEVIGRVGTTSAAESQMGPHLHFSVSRDGAVIDPRDYVGSEE